MWHRNSECAEHTELREMSKEAEHTELREMSKEAGFYDKSISKLKHGSRAFYNHLDTTATSG